jgi:hypothetical protein
MTELQGSEVNDFYGMLRIVRSLPCYRLELGIEIEQIPKVINELLSSLPTQQHKSTVLATASAPVFQPEATPHYQLDLADLTAK